MRYVWTILILSVMLNGCGGFGDYQFKSDRFGCKAGFPKNWEVWDKSDDRVDFLEARLPAVDPEAKITLRAEPVAPDINPTELYPMFLEGSGDASILAEFRIRDKGTISCQNGEGRYIRLEYLGEVSRINGMRALFIGDRFKLTVSLEMPVDVYLDHEPEFFKMINNIKL